MSWGSRVLATLALLVVAWAMLGSFGAVVHGHPAYAIVLALTVVGALSTLWVHRRRRPTPAGWRRVASVALAVGALAWLAAVMWFRPFTAEEPALAAMTSDSAVTVTESATRIEMRPTGTASATGVFFQPGALVEARAYAAVLRPLALAGHPVVIVKAPMGIGFLAMGAFDDVRAQHPEVTAWVLGGHSLGGTVASIEADTSDGDGAGPARGLLLYASYPGNDLSASLAAAVLSISGTHDGLATPEDIEGSRADLPPGSRFEAIQGAVHSSFGDYGAQPGDGQATISHDQARADIGDLSVAFVSGIN